MNENKVKTVYLSGKIAGLQEEEYQKKFADATIEAYKLFPNDYLKIINPSLLPAVHKSWAEYLISDLMFLKNCDVIVMLDNWRESKGAIVEHAFAQGCGMEICYLGEKNLENTHAEDIIPIEKENVVIPLSDVKKATILDALEKTHYNRRKAAELLGVSDRTLYRKLKEYGMQ